MSDPTKPSINSRLERSISPHHVRIPIASRPSSTRPISKSGASVVTGAFAGTPIGSTSATSSPSNTSASKKSTTACGPCTLALSISGAFTNVHYRSKTPSVDTNVGEMCKPCPQTIVSTMSPTAQGTAFSKSPPPCATPRMNHSQLITRSACTR